MFLTMITYPQGWPGNADDWMQDLLHHITLGTA